MVWTSSQLDNAYENILKVQDRGLRIVGVFLAKLLVVETWVENWPDDRRNHFRIRDTVYGRIFTVAHGVRAVVTVTVKPLAQDLTVLVVTIHYRAISEYFGSINPLAICGCVSQCQCNTGAEWLCTDAERLTGRHAHWRSINAKTVYGAVEVELWKIFVEVVKALTKNYAHGLGSRNLEKQTLADNITRMCYPAATQCQTQQVHKGADYDLRGSSTENLVGIGTDNIEKPRVKDRWPQWSETSRGISTVRYETQNSGVPKDVLTTSTDACEIWEVKDST
ncbi:hypothetical protein B0H19DRAFT_1063227 [Mycena capillaripes]|nr:hypothetical protein B0H19DRAFT_1063227 [Mycena capillaripes]